MGRSKRPPSLGRSAGARLIVTRPIGNWNRLLSRAPRTRSLLSLTAGSGRLTMESTVRSSARCTSTVTAGASIPSRARLLRTQRLKWTRQSTRPGSGASSAPRRRRAAVRVPPPPLRASPASRGWAQAPPPGHRAPREWPDRAWPSPLRGTRADCGWCLPATPASPWEGCRRGAGQGHRAVWGSTWK